MLAVEVELLTGRYVATTFNDRNRAEWPPHPARLFSAAVAAWADADEPDDRERAALFWWEEQGDPTVTCSWGVDEVSERAAVTHYVPVNDTQVVGHDLSLTYLRLRAAVDSVNAARGGDARTLTKAEQALAGLRVKAAQDTAKAVTVGHAPTSALSILPETRERQARVYPTTIPADDRVVYRWPRADARSPHVAVLDLLLARIGRIGHSSSFVSVSVVETDAPDTLLPHEGGDIALRVASPGQLNALEAAFDAHHGTEPRVLPALITSYREAGRSAPDVPNSLFGQDWLLLELVGRARFTVRDTLPLARAVRGALLQHADQDPVPEILCGHRPGRDLPTPPTTRPHLAVAPLPFVGHPRADGTIRAVALVMPAALDSIERGQMERAVQRWMARGHVLKLGSHGVADVALMDVIDAPTSAQPTRWGQPSTRWTTVTPIALDRNPGDLRHRNVQLREVAERRAEELVAAACTHIGLPAPARVALHSGPLVSGSASVRSFPKYTTQGGRLQRVLVHAAIEFDEPVRGPLLLGAGRYLGYGLCLPVNDHPDQKDA